MDPKDRQDLINEGALGCDDPVIKDMKLKGEFPCRLCPAIYPNLRALKGHNKEHLGGKPPYECNVGKCTYSSSDKSTLTRHMRSHTGTQIIQSDKSILQRVNLKLISILKYAL